MRFKWSLFIKLLGLTAILALAILPWLKKLPTSRAGNITSITATAASTVKSTSTTYTIVFTPATAITGNAGVSINFQAPPDARFGVGSASLATGSSSVFQSVGYRNTEYGSVSVDATSLPATELTLKLSGIVNPSKDGKYGMEVDTHSGYSSTDRGMTSVTVGTMAVEGRVTVPGGAGANGAWVEAQEKNNWNFHAGGPTDANGYYGIGGLTSGKTYKINVYLNPDPNNTQSNTKGLTSPDGVEVAYGGTTVTQNFALKPATKTVTGRLAYANGTVIADGRVSAMRTDGSGFVNSSTNSSGDFSLSMSGGAWEIRPDTFAGPGQTPPDYAFSGPGTRVQFAKDDSIESKTGVNFTVVKANSTVTGSVTPIPGGGSGIGLHNRSGFGTGTGIDPNTGGFSFKVPAGSYEIDFFTDFQQSSGDRYALPEMDPITVGDGETKNLGSLTLVKMDKTINVTVKDNASGTGLGGFMIGCFKPRGGGFAMGQTDGTGAGQVKVTAGEWGCMAMSGMGMKGGPEGGEGPQAMLLNKLFDTAYAAEGEGTETKYVVMGGPQFRTVGDTPATINFTALEANRTVNVTTVNASGTAISVDGFIEARLVNSNLGDDFDKGGSLGEPINPMSPGIARLRVPAGIYDLFMMTPPGSDYSPGDSTRVDVTSADANATIVLLANDSTIQGTLKDSKGATITNVFAMIGAVNPMGAFIPGDVNPGTGTYSMNVPSAGGTLSMGYFVDPESGYFPQSSTGTVTPVAGQTHSFDITMKRATATLTVTVKDPSGNALANAFVEANNKKTGRGDKMDFFFHNGDQTDANGQISLLLPDGQYNVEAFLPKETLLDNKWIPPKPTQVTLTENDTESATLQFQTADVELKGKVTKADGTAVSGATVSAYSENGEAINTETNASGDYVVNITAGDWHVVANNDDTLASSKPEPYKSDNVGFATGTSKSMTENLTVAKGDSLPAAVTASFDTDNATVVSLADAGGKILAEIKAPANAFDSDGEGSSANLSASAVEELIYTKTDVPLSIGMEISAQSNTGQAITSTTTSVPISLKMERGALTNNGLALSDIGTKVNLSYFDDENGLWKPVEGSTSALEEDGNADGDVTDATDFIKVTGSTSHFTTFAVTAAADTVAPAAPTGVSATAGDKKITLQWTKATDADLAGVKIYRSTTSGTVGELITTTTSSTTASYENTGLTNGTKYYYVVRSYDTVGNISSNTTQVNATPAAAGTTTALPATGMSDSFSWLWLAGIAPILYIVRKKFSI